LGSAGRGAGRVVAAGGRVVGRRVALGRVAVGALLVGGTGATAGSSGGDGEVGTAMADGGAHGSAKASSASSRPVRNHSTVNPSSSTLPMAAPISVHRARAEAYQIITVRQRIGAGVRAAVEEVLQPGNLPACSPPPSWNAGWSPPPSRR
jgi:hypothetical protein